MKCTNKFLADILCIILCSSLVACKDNTSELATYDLYNSSFSYGITNNGSDSNVDYFASNLCIADTEDIGVSQIDSQVAKSAGAFNLNTKEVLYSQSVHEQIYPASTTKIMTCLVAVMYGNLDDYYTISENAVNQPKDSSVCGLKAGDIISLRDLLYGLMLRSGNDAAIAIAEGVSGDVDTFVGLMNSTAKALGATNTHYINPNGLHNDDHYTTVYDMYLILNAAIENEDFYSVFTASSYTSNYTSNGSEKTVDWKSTNQYFSGNTTAPNGMVVLGGKTGTTGAAGYCLGILSENEKHEKIISFVFNADCKSNLYLLMNEILSNYCI